MAVCLEYYFEGVFDMNRKYTDEQLIQAVKNSTSIRDVLGFLGKSKQGGGSYNQVKRDFERLNLDISHFKGMGHCKPRFIPEKWETKDILVEDSQYTNATSMKKRLLKEGLLKNVCYECGQTEEWNGKHLVMVMDHINGVNNDNRIENLRMLCPNCNSQQSTFAGRNRAVCRNGSRD